MSVLVESISIIVRRRTLDAQWPGGTDAYLTAAVASDPPAQLACADDQLTAVGFLSAEDCQAWFENVENHGIDEMTWVDPVSDPPSRCEWIEWRQHPDGFTYAWLAGTEPGELVAPETRRPRRSEHPATPPARVDRMFQLSTENGLKIWLDLDTGEQVVSLASTTEAAPSSAETPPQRALCDSVPLMPIVRATLATLGWKPDFEDDDSVRVRIAGKPFLFPVVVSVDDVARTIACWGVMPVRADAERCAAVAETIVRINLGLRLGSFDLDFDDGEIRFRVGCDVEGGTLTERMVISMLGNVCTSIDRCGAVLMQVLFGQASPDDAARRALETYGTPQA